MKKTLIALGGSFALVLPRKMLDFIADNSPTDDPWLGGTFEVEQGEDGRIMLTPNRLRTNITTAAKLPIPIRQKRTRRPSISKADDPQMEIDSLRRRLIAQADERADERG